MKKVLLTATVQSHIAQFHKPLINMLKENGYEVHVAAKDNLKEKNGLTLDEPDKIFEIAFNRSPLSKDNVKAYQQLSRVLSESKYDVVHCNTPMGGVLTRLAANKYRKTGTKVFYTAHGFHFYKGAPLKNWILYYPLEKYLAKFTDKLITITKEDYRLAKEKFKSNIYHIHGTGADSEKYSLHNNYEIENMRKQKSYSNSQFIILVIGELNNNKNQETIIKALFQIKKSYRNVKLLIAGNGPKEKYLANLVSKLRLNDSVEFLGYRTDLIHYLAICNAVVSASYREGLPLNIMEAMLCGKPTVGSLNRGHKELIKNAKTGYLINPTDVNGFSKCIIKLISSPKLCKKLGENALINVKPYESKYILKELKNIYD